MLTEHTVGATSVVMGLGEGLWDFRRGTLGLGAVWRLDMPWKYTKCCDRYWCQTILGS
jgi:hypothetical protein